MADVSVVIPIGPAHEHVAARAIASAENQTVPCRVITARDPDRHGAGWARNQGTRQVQTRWVLYLDADDWLEPNAVERLLWQAGEAPGHYVYSDWYNGAGVWMPAPDTGHSWCGGTWHAISALVPIQWVVTVGGFDETLPAGEDTEFFLKLTTSLRCGVRLPEPLLHYSADGQRGIWLATHPEEKEKIWAGFKRTYGGRMGCCGEITVAKSTDAERREGDVLAIALWGGNQRKIGPATGHLYRRAGNGTQMWVNERDVNAAPHLWRKVEASGEDAVDAQAVVANIGDLADFMNRGQTIRYRPERDEPPPPSAPDIERIIRMGLEALG